jgi:hypothetical protein
MNRGVNMGVRGRLEGAMHDAFAREGRPGLDRLSPKPARGLEELLYDKAMISVLYCTLLKALGGRVFQKKWREETGRHDGVA